MFYSKETILKRVNYRINLLRARDEVGNMKLINALIREARKYESNY